MFYQHVTLETAGGTQYEYTKRVHDESPTVMPTTTAILAKRDWLRVYRVPDGNPVYLRTANVECFWDHPIFGSED